MQDQLEFIHTETGSFRFPCFCVISRQPQLMPYRRGILRLTENPAKRSLFSILKFSMSQSFSHTRYMRTHSLRNLDIFDFSQSFVHIKNRTLLQVQTRQNPGKAIHTERRTAAAPGQTGKMSSGCTIDLTAEFL